MNVGAGNALWVAVKADTSIWNDINGSFYPNVLPDIEAYPAVVWGQLSEDVDDTKDGPINNGFLFQIDIYAEDYFSAQNIALALRKKLHWYTLVSDEIGTCRISYKDQGDAVFIEEKELLHIIQDYKVRVKNPPA